MKLCPDCMRCYEDGDRRCADPAHEPLMLARPGSLLIAGKYRLERLIARGGMGAVYQGRHVELDRPVAVKLLRHDVIADAEARERFRREARAVARIRHPNVADLYDYGALPEGDAYIVMELVRGETLRQRLERVGRLPVEEASRIGAQIAEGIEAAHRSGVLHRDLKPSNVVLSDEHGGLQARVVDFSIAKFVDPEDGARLTASGAFLGTPQYMSPEQCSGEEPDTRADVYGLGVILYEMFAGYLPFDGPAPAAVAVRQIQAAVPPLAFARPGIAPLIASLVKECLAKDPDQRPQTAAEVAARLRPFEAEASTDPVALRAPSLQPFARARSPADTNPAGGEPRSAESTAREAAGIGAAVGPEPTGLSYWRSLDTRERGGLRVPPRPLVVYGGLAVALVGTIVLLRIAIELMPARGGRPAPAPAVATRPDPPAAQVRPVVTPLSSPALAAATPSPEPIAAGARPRRTLPANRNRNPERKPRQPIAIVFNPIAADPIEALHRSLDGWIASTNARDVSAHMRFYLPRVSRFYLQRNVSRDFVRDVKRELFERATSIAVTAGEPEIQTERDGQEATMRFRKRYVIERPPGNRRGEVVQELRWIRTAQGWRISSERDAMVIR